MLRLIEPSGPDRRCHDFRFFTVDRAVFELDHRIELLPGEPVQVCALARPQRPSHDLVVDPPLVQRLLHPPAWSEPPWCRAAMELDCHPAEDTPRSHSDSLRRVFLAERG